MTAGQPMSRSVFATRLREFPDLAFAERSVFGHRGKWGAFFSERMGARFLGRLIVEIGCFNAAFLCDIAAAHPEAAFVGIDWKCKAIFDGAKHISSLGLDNVVLLRARGQDLGKLFGEAEADEIWIFHPDPCDRAAERKNRLMNESFLRDAHVVLKNGDSTLTLKTDHRDYYRSVADQFSPASIARRSSVLPFQIAIQTEDFWHDTAALAHTSGRHFANRTTLFERRFIRQHAPIYLIELRKIMLAIS